MRDIVEIVFEGKRLVGTWHRPEIQGRVAQAQGGSGRNLALLWLNAGYLPRSPVGDVIPHIADRLALRGMGSFRFDMPGLGDSEGTLTDSTQTFVSMVVRGLHAPAACAVSRELQQQFKLDGILMGGICGASVTSLFAAASGKVGNLAGLVLLDPSFKLVQPLEPPPGEPPRPPQGMALAKKKSKQLYQELRVKVLQTKWGERSRAGWRRVKPLLAPFRGRARQGKGEKLPGDANRPLVEAFGALARQRLPMLVLMAGSEEAQAARFDYIAGAMRTPGHAISLHYLEGTSHSFSEGNGEASVIERLEAWLAESHGCISPACLASAR